MDGTIECSMDSTGGGDTLTVAAGSPPAPSRSRGTIVIAEDDVATRMLLCRILTRASFIVHAFENGELACEAIRLRHPDVVLLDWMMPVMDGHRAVVVLKADAATRAIPIVMLTTHSCIEDRMAALEAGVQDFLTKPFDARELVACIDQQVSRLAPVRAAVTVPANGSD